MIAEVIRKKWNDISIKRKINIFACVVFLTICTSATFTVWVVQFSVVELNRALEDNVRVSEVVEGIREENQVLLTYAKAPNNSIKELMIEKIEETEQMIEKLIFDYHRIGEKRYMKTWAILNSYPVYKDRTLELLDMEPSGEVYIDALYTIYEMQGYMEGYGIELLNLAVEDGNMVSKEKEPLLRVIMLIAIVFGIAVILNMFQFAKIMNKTLIAPILQLADASKKIANNEFLKDAIVVDNKDELGRLVSAFNRMNFATVEHITVLEEKRKTQELLHEEELQRLEVEKRLEATRFELLKNQIHPHFLFNTLNVIAGMADLEEAETTEKMIKSLSYLFRYNLKTEETIVPLKRELKLISDYMYLQQMRFGKRISFEVDCRVDEEETLIPAFIFQPLIENAIIHGVAKKEEGGKIRVRIQKKGEVLKIHIIDSGQGIEKQRLKELKHTLESYKATGGGIGVTNVWRRIYGMYPTAQFFMKSHEGMATSITIFLPVIIEDEVLV